jgi:P-type Cu2+ transporter
LHCAHSGTPATCTPADLPTTDEGRWYCCAGCQTVAEALALGGLTDWYQLAGADRAPARTTARKYEELDDPAFAARHVEVRDDGLCATKLYLEDLRCTACVWLVERLPTIERGVVEARVDLGRGLAEVVFDPAQARLSKIGAALDRLGHPVHPYRDVDRDTQRRREDRALLVKIGLAGAAAGNIMLLAIALYAGWLGGAMTAMETAFLRWASMLVALPVLSYAATPFFRTALASLRSRRLHLDLPIAVGIAAGLGWGTVNVVRGSGEIYFDSVGMLVFLLLIARFVQTRHQRKASIAAEMLMALTPRRVRLVTAADRAIEVPIEAVKVGELIEVLPGETVPLDGVIERGVTAVDRGLLTGEARPIEVGVGDSLFAGTVNLSAPVRVRAAATGESTRIGQLVSRVAELARRRAPIERFVDRLAGRFVVVIASVAALTWIGWALAGHPGPGLEHAMALLVVTCPCALALATPLAVSVALSRAARRGILIKGAEVLEHLAEPGVLVLDKTGTITQGVQRVTAWVGEASAAALASALEAKSTHPVARALRDHAAPCADPVTDLRETFGRGLRGRVGGVAVAVGSPSWISSFATVPLALMQERAAAQARGDSSVMVAVDGVVVALAALSDPIRADAAEAVAAIRELGWQVEVLSGDDEAAVRRAGRSLGLAPEACRGGVLPEDKASRIEALTAQQRGPVVMVGDGVNDAGALAAARCGIAMHGSAEASIEAADIYCSRPGVASLVTILRGASATMRTIRRNLRISLFYNVTAGLLAVTGVIHPLVAAVMMPLSSLTVLLSSVRSRAMLTAPPARRPLPPRASPGATTTNPPPSITASSAPTALPQVNL